MFYTLGGALPPFFVGAGQFSPVSGAVRGAAAGAQSAPARPPAQAGGWAGFAGAARKTAAAPPPGFHLRRRERIPQKAGQAIATLRFPLQSAARHRQSHLRAPPLAITPLHAGAVRGAAAGAQSAPARPAPGPPPASVGAHTPKAIGLNSCPKNAKKWPTATFLQCAILR